MDFKDDFRDDFMRRSAARLTDLFNHQTGGLF